jgi:diguanylate cyclase (GGDEF)-like protein/putative nucleotidyltransferase with HDIG domain
MPLRARIYIGSIVAAGAALFASAFTGWACADPVHYLCQAALAIIAAGLKVNLPGVTGTMSVSYLFILLSMIDFGYPEMVLVACLSIAAQSLWKTRSRPRVLQVIFNLASMTVVSAAGYATYHGSARWGQSMPVRIAAAATAYFICNTLSVAVVVSLTEAKSLRKVWRECYFWSYAYYLVGGGIAAVISVCNRRFGWQTVFLALPVVYIIFRSYRLYLGKLESEKTHAEQIAALHLRTIEALALAIEAKDDTTHEHLQRVQVYALELGKKMAMPDGQLQALRAASILHDIGKLAVPEHIISKPGKLTPEEFEKMKIHPIVGAEILARVQFPYNVAPIVRAHHEKWDGTGYPDGIAGEEIPLGARVLAVVDCLDALASDRQYRRALPLDEAMEAIAKEAGVSFDPRVVEVLRLNYREWEKMAWNSEPAGRLLSKDVRVVNGKAPAAGLQAGDSQQPEFLTSIAAARQEAQTLYELTQDLGNSLNLHETLSVLDSRLQRLIPYDAIAVYVLRDGKLFPEYVNGENFRLFSSLEIPLGQGLSGWVAETGKPIMNGNPSVEPGYLNDPTKFSVLRSALAAPLENAVGVIGVLALYHLGRDAFTKDHLRVLLAINPKVSLTVENALKFQQAAISATTDVLTSLPNARSLFLHLDAELSRARRNREELAVLMCDLDGFKQVNDRFGHLEGNRVLKLVSLGLRECCREYDYVARMGGDEFVLVLPGLRPPDLGEKVKALERVVIEAGVTVCGERLLNISVGAAFCPDHGNDAEGLLAEADRRMYLTKQEHKSTHPTVAEDLAALAASVGGDSLSLGDRVSPVQSVSSEPNQQVSDGEASAIEGSE